MAVIYLPTSYLVKKTGYTKEEAVETLNNLGFPTEEEEENLVVEVTPDRLDMLTYEGIIRTLITYREKKPKDYSVGVGPEIIIKEVKQRPFITGFVAEGIKDSDYFLEGIISAQEKIHQTFGRKRKKISIGIHNLDVIEFPLEYKEVEDISFIPLGWEKEASIEEILREHEKGQMYGNLVNKPYPMVVDRRGVVSFPPIINAERTRVNEECKNFLVDITGTDKNAINDVARVLATALADRGCEIKSLMHEGRALVTLDRYEVGARVDDINRLGGVDFSEEDIRKELLKSNILFSEGKARCPPYRYDIYDESDICEEVLINYGYENLKEEPFHFDQIGEVKEIMSNERKELLFMGYVETLGFFLINKELQERVLGKEVMEIPGAVSREHNSMRETLMFSLLDVAAKNKMEKLPQKFFEIGNVYRSGKEFIEIGFIRATEKSSINEMLSELKRLAKATKRKIDISEGALSYFSPFFVEGRSYVIDMGDIEGVFGEISPKVNEVFGINNVLCACVLWKKTGL